MAFVSVVDKDIHFSCTKYFILYETKTLYWVKDVRLCISFIKACQ